MLLESRYDNQKAEVKTTTSNMLLTHFHTTTHLIDVDDLIAVTKKDLNLI
jgi:hypothetical protein